MDLVSLLKSHIGRPLTSDLAADICVVANQIPTLVHLEKIERIKPTEYRELPLP